MALYLTRRLRRVDHDEKPRHRPPHGLEGGGNKAPPRAPETAKVGHEQSGETDEEYPQASDTPDHVVECRLRVRDLSPLHRSNDAAVAKHKEE
eukprot:CAMPEP_0171316420 /NCGR_PEP_ID=MMETSP0816-20121228/72661_1 /TAXON_ID=420281 /ORGANISM="Proboscia inermis, Strain CCAP1064/1" /LENGTH=92 /DNA_ID=CAMNT_0011808397 /DNA_START=446 /DNA_END=720 /DNA_ORIENTATION=+